MTTDADHIRAAIHAFDCGDLTHFNDDMRRVTVDALLAKQGKLVQQARVPSSHRWNVERDGDDLLVCFNDHDKGEKCDYKRFVPASSQQQARVPEGWREAIQNVRRMYSLEFFPDDGGQTALIGRMARLTCDNIELEIGELEDAAPTPPQDQSILPKIESILAGIDKTEIESESGWWETSTGAEHGAAALKQIRELLSQQAPIPHSFNAWWDSYEESGAVRFRYDSPAFWAYEGWLACERASQTQEPT